MLDEDFGRTDEDDFVVRPPAFGSYHMYHYIGGKVIAIGVIDILENMIVSQ